jgi:sugar phosphate isomerase/epimerase
MHLSCCVWALTAPEEDVLSAMQSLGFRWIDIRPQMQTTPAARASALARGLKVSSVAASWGMPENAALDSADSDARSLALAHVDQVAIHCAALGGRAVYLVPGADDSQAALSRFADSLATAAEHGAARGVRLSVEHFPGTALPTAAGTLDFIRAIGHPNLGLLFDIGHAQISGEDPAEVIRQAGEHLAYVHLDDNDGEGDLHWALLDGVLAEETLRQTFRALADIGYAGPVSLELSPQLGDPRGALQRSREIVLNLGSEYFLES